MMLFTRRGPRANIFDNAANDFSEFKRRWQISSHEFITDVKKQGKKGSRFE